MRTNTSGLKRGLATVAVSALAVTGIPLLASAAHAAPTDSLVASTVKGYSAFDVDELVGSTDDLVATLKDQNGTPIQGKAVHYSYTFTPDGGAAQPPTDYAATVETTDADGKVAIPFTDLGAGSYTLNVQLRDGNTVEVQGTPVSFNVGESEIEWADGNSAGSPVNGSDTYTGRLALTEAGGAGLGGRKVAVSWTPGGDAVVATSQPDGTQWTSNTTANATTAADGTFSVTLFDPPVTPPAEPSPETGTLDASAAALAVGDGPDADAADTLTVNFRKAPVVSRVELDVNTVDGFGDYAPGKPAAVEVDVYAADGDTNPDNDPLLENFPVTVSVDKGFLSPYDDADANDLDADELVLADGQDDAGDLFGFYAQLGSSEDLETGDAGATGDSQGSGEVGIVAAMERDEGFDDNGRAEMEITVNAGGVTETESVTFDSRDYLNLPEVSLDRAPGEPTGQVKVNNAVDFRLIAKDQFGNLVGDQQASITDDTPVAEVTTDGDFGSTRTDFVNDNDGIRANSESPAIQTLRATLDDVEMTTVGAAGNPVSDEDTVTEDADPIRWVTSTSGGPAAIKARITKATSKKGKDVLTIKAPRQARGAKVVLYGKIRGKVVKLKKGKLNNQGKLVLKVRDRNGKKKTQYAAIVKATSRTQRDVTNVKTTR